MSNSLERTSATTREFTLELLQQITDNFSEKHVIGRGGFGVVYKGVLDDGEEIALKKLHYIPGLDDTQFRNEFNNLMRAQHPNITRLVGYCYHIGHQRIMYNGEYIFAHVEERILCFEYLHGGSLDKHISDESCGLDWHTRFKIIRGVSEGLNYLHNGCKNPIYHLDLKPQNILLDKNMVPKIGDFGLSRLFPSAQTYIASKIMGTVGYMPPEYIDRHEITSKFDVFSLGVIIIRIVAGYDGYSKCTHMSSQGFVEHVLENWRKRLQATISRHTSEQVKRCIKISLRCVEVDRVKRSTITDIVDELNNADAIKCSCIGQNAEKPEHTTLEKHTDIQEQKKKTTNEQVDISCRTKKILPTPVTVDLPKARVADAISSVGSRLPSPHDQDIQDHALNLQSGLERLRDTLPAMYNLIDRAEWNMHEKYVGILLPNIEDALYDANDLLDEFRWYEMKGKLEGDERKFHSSFFDSVIKGNFNRLNVAEERLDHLSSQLKKLGLSEAMQHFVKSIRPETIYLPTETKLFGRDKELKQLMKFLGVSADSKRERAASKINKSRSRSSSDQGESRIINLPVLPIVGIGGVGKTTLAQHICSDEKVKSYFELRIWISVSNDFDMKRLTKEVIQSCTGNKATSDNLDSLQHALSNHVNNKKILTVLDDMWDDSLKENGQCWNMFCAPLKSAQEGSLMVVTTRSRMVSEEVHTLQPIILEGLEDDIFWNFFKLWAFGSESSNNDPDLESIGEKLLPKLKGSPLAAKTLGCILRMDLQVSCWNGILESELWESTQEETDILPALRLSYMYLPLRLKRCFSFCAVYPKYYKFKKEDLAEIWVAEGFVEPEDDYPIQDIGCHYFEELVARSFFHRASGHYIIHDLLHEMVQKVSENDCFILRNKNDFDKVSKNVRHIYILESSNVVNSDLLSLCKYTKLRTILCEKQLLGWKAISVMDNWCTELLCMRVVSFESAKLPDSIGNWKHLRYLKIEDKCPLSFPSTFCWLYHLQILDVKKCKIQSLPTDFNKLISLQRFKSHGFSYYSGGEMSLDGADKEAHGILRLIKNLNQFRGCLDISHVGMLSKDDAAEAELKNKKHLSALTLNWDSAIIQHSAMEVLQVLQPPISLRSLLLRRYPGASLPSWFHPQNLPSLTSLTFENCDGFVSISCSMTSQNINLIEIPTVPNDSYIGVFMSLTEVRIEECQNLLSLEHFLVPDYIPAIKIIRLQNCESLVLVPTEQFSQLCFLEELYVYGCPNISSQSLVSTSLMQLHLGNCGSLLVNLECGSLTKFIISTGTAMSIQPQMWALPSLQELEFRWCRSLTSIGVSTNYSFCEGTGSIRAFSKLISLKIEYCEKLSILDGLLGLPSERFPSLKHLSIRGCQHLNWQTGLVLPSSLQTLKLDHCGDFSSCIPGFLENLTSLVSLKMGGCLGLTCIPGTIWRNNLASLEELKIWDCPNLVSIGGANTAAKIKEVLIINCQNLKEAEAEQIKMRKNIRSSRRNS